MHEQENNNDSQTMSRELQAFEAQLAQLQPRAAQFDRDRLFYLAGQASAQAASLPDSRQQLLRWYWPVSSVVMTGVAAGLLCALVLRDTRPHSEMDELVGPGAVVHAGGQPAHRGQAALAVRQIEGDSRAAVRMRLPADVDRLLDDDWLVAHAAVGSESSVNSFPETTILSPRSLDQFLDERGDDRRPPVPHDKSTNHSTGAKS